MSRPNLKPHVLSIRGLPVLQIPATRLTSGLFDSVPLLIAALSLYILVVANPRNHLALVLVLLIAKFKLLRPLMMRRTKAGDYALAGKANLRDFLFSLVPRNEGQLYTILCYSATMWIFVSNFHFELISRLDFSQVWHFLFVGNLIALLIHALNFVFLLMRLQVFYTLQMLNLGLTVLLMLSGYLLLPNSGDFLSLAEKAAVLAFWITAMGTSSWRMRASFFPWGTSRVMRPTAFPPRAPGRYRIVLIKPTSGYDSNPYANRYTMFPSILPMVAATVPEHWDVMILDEVHNEIDYDLDVDVVGITTMSLFFPSGREIARRYRAKGKTVIFGGVDASRYPDQYLEHADSVLVGEAFDFFPRLLKDWEEGKLQRLYKNDTKHDLKGLPLPRNDLLPRMRYNNYHTILVSTSCPFACEFCTYAKSRMTRLRPIEDLVAAIRHSKGRYFWFEAPELLAYKPYIKRLSSELKNEGIHWSTHASMKSASDPENLKNAYDSGLRSVRIGVESFSQEALHFVNKRSNTVSEYLRTFRLLDKAGISVGAHLIFGFPQDNEESLKAGLELLRKGKVARIIPHNLGLYEGAQDPFEAKLIAAGAGYVDIFAHYNKKMKLNFKLMRPANITDQEYVRLKQDFILGFYSWPSIMRRLFLRSPKNFGNLVPDLWMNVVSHYLGRKETGESFFFYEQMDQLFELEPGTAEAESARITREKQLVSLR